MAFVCWEFWGGGGVVNYSSKKADTGMNLYSIKMKWTDPEQQTTTDPNVTDFHVTIFVTQAQ